MTSLPARMGLAGGHHGVRNQNDGSGSAKSLGEPQVDVEAVRIDSIRILLRSFATSTTPWNGRARSLGAAEKSGSSVFLITPRGNGLWPRCGRRILRQFCRGRVRTTFIATARGRTASTQADFSNTGGTAASCATNTAIRIPTVGTSTPANV